MKATQMVGSPSDLSFLGAAADLADADLCAALAASVTPGMLGCCGLNGSIFFSSGMLGCPEGDS